MLSQPDAELIGAGRAGAADVTGRRPRPREQGLPRRRRGLGRCAADRVRSQARSRSSPATAATSDRQPQRFRPPAPSRSWPMRVPEPTAPGRSARRRCRSSKRGRSTCSACSSDNRPARIVTHESPHYIYDLAGAWNGFVPDGAVLEGATRKLGAIVERYDSLGPARADGHQVWAMPLGWMPGGLRPPSASSGRWRCRARSRTTSARSRSGSARSRCRDAGWRHRGASSPRRSTSSPRARRREDQWFGGPITSRVSPSTAPWDYSSPYRQERLPPARDAAVRRPGGPPGRRPLPGRVRRASSSRTGSSSPRATIRSACRRFVPPERHDYRLVYSVFRHNAFWQRSSRATTEWEFSSQRPEGDHEVTALLSIDYDLRLSETNTAPGGEPFSFGLGFRMPPEVVVKPLARVERRGLVGRRGVVDGARRPRVPEAEIVHGQAEESALRLGIAAASRRPTRPGGGDPDRDRRLRRRLAGRCRGRSAQRESGEGRT